MSVFGVSWSVFSHIRTEDGEIRSIFPYSVRMRENTDQENSKYGHFSRSDTFSLEVQIKIYFAFALTCLTHKKVIHSSNGDQLEDVEVKYILLFSSFEVMPQMLKRRTYFSTYSKSSLQFILILPHSTVPLVFLPKTRIQWNKAKSWLKYMNKSRINS